MPGRRATTSKMNKSQNSQLDTMKSIESPGPGQYNIKGAIGEGPKSSLSYRYKTDIEAKESNQKPGPGSYAPTVDSISKKAPNFKIGTSTREKYYLHEKFKYNLPPPNIYDPQFERLKQASPATSFGYGDRSKLNKTFTAPGPGNYMI